MDWSEIEAQAERFTEHLFGQLELHPLTCPICEMHFGIEKTAARFVEQTGQTIYCPNGHQHNLGYRKS